MSTDTRYGITVNYDASTGKSQEILIWSGAFMAVYEGYGRIRKGSKSFTVLTYNDDKVTVRFPEGVTGMRDQDNYEQIDQAISTALNAHHTARGDFKMEVPA